MAQDLVLVMALVSVIEVLVVEVLVVEVLVLSLVVALVLVLALVLDRYPEHSHYHLWSMRGQEAPRTGLKMRSIFPERRHWPR